MFAPELREVLYTGFPGPRPTRQRRPVGRGGYGVQFYSFCCCFEVDFLLAQVRTDIENYVALIRH
jgi:hypothetical protein